MNRVLKNRISLILMASVGLTCLGANQAQAGVLYGEANYEYNLQTQRGSRGHFTRRRASSSTAVHRRYRVPGISKGASHLNARYYKNKQSRVELAIENAEYKRELLIYKKKLAVYKKQQLLKKKKLEQLKRKREAEKRAQLRAQRRKAKSGLANGQQTSNNTKVAKRAKKRSTFWTRLKSLFSDNK